MHVSILTLLVTVAAAAFPDSVKYSPVNIWPMPLNVTIPKDVTGPRGLSENFEIVTRSCPDSRIESLAHELVDLTKQTIFRGPLRSYQESAYASLHNATCELSMRCLSDDDCESNTFCFVPSDERWSRNGSACSPVSTLGYSAKCGCCVDQKSFRSIQSLIVICDSTDGDDESHTIDVNSTAIVLKSSTATGAARGLATISQLLRYDIDKEVLIMDVVPLKIFDKPSYVWRGVMIDTARHFVPHDDILRLIDGMYAGKLNKLHIHATDSTAWTLRSDAYPELAEEGSWSHSAATFYSKSDIKSIVQRGQERFVDVLFELDTPAHTLSISRSHPEMMAQCWEWLATSGFKVDVDSDDTISLNPVNTQARNMVRSVLQEIADLSLSPYVHIGGDEVKYPCWNASDEIREHVESVYGNSSTVAYALLQAEWTANVSAAAVVSKNKIPVLWQPTTKGYGDPVWDNALPSNSIYMVWLNADSAASYAEHGRNVVYTTPYYVAGMGAASGYIDVYNAQLMPKNLTSQQKQFILGGQVCAWGESMAGGSRGMDFRAFTIGAGAAESFWRDHDPGQSPAFASGLALGDRYNRFLCHLRRYGIDTIPTMPSYCDVVSK